MTTETSEARRERPEKVEVGQRYTVGDGSTCTIVEMCDGGETARMWWDKERFHGREVCKQILHGYTYLGPRLTTSREPDKEPLECSADKPPAPAAGQRWRDTGIGENVWLYRKGEPFVVGGRKYPGGTWYVEGDESNHWSEAAFTNGRLAFVDHGTDTSGSEATGPTVEVVCRKCTRNPCACAPVRKAAPREFWQCQWKRLEVRHGAFTGRPEYHEVSCASDVAHGRSPYCEKHISEAMAQREAKPTNPNLPDFSLPGSNPSQTTAYRTRSLREPTP